MHPSIANLTFGIELEVVIPGETRTSAADRLSTLSGLSVSPAGGNSWKLVNDGSINGHGLCVEVVSPILQGDAGLEQCAKICSALIVMGARVNQSTGFHVHVGSNGQQVDYFKNLIKLYAKFEDAIDGIMPPSRRANGNTYCRSIKPYASSIEHATSLSQVLRTVGDRYKKVNFQAMSAHGTVEFRHHAGTVDAGKVTNLVQVCLKLCAAAAAGKTGEAINIARDFSTMDAKMRLVAEMTTRPEGASAEEIRTAGEFKALSVHRQARLAGLQLTERKVRGQPLRFFATAPGGSVAVPPTIEGLAEVIDAEEGLRSYLVRRRREVSI